MKCMKIMKFLITVFLGLSFSIMASTAAFAIDQFALPWMSHPDQTDEENILFRSTDYPNGIFVIEGYYRACGLCNWNATYINALAAEYRNEPRVHVLDVGLDGTRRLYDQWIEETEPNHPVLKDVKRVVVNQLGFAAYPSTAIVDCHGNIRLKHQGYWGDNSPAPQEFRKIINEMLQEDCAASDVSFDE